MPSVNHSRIPAYRKHKATGQAVVTLNGRDCYLGRYATAASRREYDRTVAEWLARGQQPAQPDTATINEVLLAYWRFAEGYYRDSPKELEKIKLAVRPLKALYGTVPASRFGPLALKAVRQSMIDAGLSRLSINIRVGVIKRALKWAVENELIPASVFHGVQAVAGLRAGRSDAKENLPVKPVPAAFVMAVLPHVAAPVAALIQLQELTGARPGELVIMRAIDIDTSGRVWIYKPPSHKNQYRGHHREIDIGPKAQEILKPFLKTDLQAYLFSPAEARVVRFRNLRLARKTNVQPSQENRQKKSPKKLPGDRYTVESYRRAIKYGCRAADLQAHRQQPDVPADQVIVPDWHPHQLRHNAATILRKEFGVELARIILGHATAFTTEIYAEADKVQAMEVIGRVG